MNLADAANVAEEPLEIFKSCKVDVIKNGSGSRLKKTSVGEFNSGYSNVVLP
jgi:hypothetical protein